MIPSHAPLTGDFLRDFLLWNLSIIGAACEQMKIEIAHRPAELHEIIQLTNRKRILL